MFFVLSLIYCACYFLKFRKHFASIKKLPGPKGILFSGNAHLFALKKPSEMLNLVLKYHQKYPKIFCFSYFHKVKIVIADPKFAEFLLKNLKFIQKSEDYKLLEPWLATGLITTSDSEKWHARRKIITPAFHLKILEQFIDVFNKNGEILVEKLRKSEEKIVDIFHMIGLCSLDIICGKQNLIKNTNKLNQFIETSMGVKINAQNYSNSVYVRAVKE